MNEGDWPDYLGPGETPGIYRVPMYLLAVASAFPSLARPWLLWLLETPKANWQLSSADIQALAARHADTTDIADWELLARGLDQLDVSIWRMPDSALLAKWAPRVARYTF